MTILSGKTQHSTLHYFNWHYFLLVCNHEVCPRKCRTNRDMLTSVYSLKDMSKPIGVSAYQVTSNLPEELEKQLPSIEDIQNRIK